VSLQDLEVPRRVAPVLSGLVLKRAPHRACSLGSDMHQPMDGLRRANEVRALRAQLKFDPKAGRVSIGALLLDPPWYLTNPTSYIREGNSRT
jgi:hypothetical protein